MLRRGGILIVALFALPACTLNFSIDSLPDGDVSVADGNIDGSAADDGVDSNDGNTPDGIADGNIDGSTADGTVDASDTVDVPVVIDGNCTPPYVLCGGSCVDEAIDPTHCGSCTNVCSGAANATPACASSACTFVCVVHFANCDNVASTGCEIDTATDDLNCGACGVLCHGGHHCAGGVCL